MDLSTTIKWYIFQTILIFILNWNQISMLILTSLKDKIDNDNDTIYFRSKVDRIHNTYIHFLEQLMCFYQCFISYLVNMQYSSRYHLLHNDSFYMIMHFIVPNFRVFAP